MISVSFLFEDENKKTTKLPLAEKIAGGIGIAGGALYNKIKHGEAFGDVGIDIPKSALTSAALTGALNVVSPSEKNTLKKSEK